MTGQATPGVGDPGGAAVLAAFARREAPALALAGQAEAVARACHQMAVRFHRGGKLLVFGTGARATDAQHVAVEFVHPVIVGKRALPALSLVTDAATLTGVTGRSGASHVFSHQLRAVAGPDDIALGLAGDDADPAVGQGLAEAGRLGLLTVLVRAGNDADTADQQGRGQPVPDHLLVVPSPDAHVVKEIEVCAYHVLWELVQVFFEHPGTLEAPEVAR